jgi:hypothetical protein
MVWLYSLMMSGRCSARGLLASLRAHATALPTLRYIGEKKST